jgi:hypothetical protein
MPSDGKSLHCLWKGELKRAPIPSISIFLLDEVWHTFTSKYFAKPEALKSLYRSPGYKKNQLVLCKNYVLQW